MADEHHSVPILVALEGNLGSGKSTFLDWFNGPGVTRIPEPVSKWVKTPKTKTNLLKKMYRNPGTTEFLFDIYVGLTRMEQLKRAHGLTTIRVMERSLLSTVELFAEMQVEQGKLSPLEWEVLNEWYDQVRDSATYTHKVEPDLFIYIKTSPEVAMKRVKKRARAEEKNMDLDYLRKVSEMHDKVFVDEAEKLPGRVLVIDGDTDRTHYAPLYKQVWDEIEKVQKKKWADHLELEKFMNMLEGDRFTKLSRSKMGRATALSSCRLVDPTPPGSEASDSEDERWKCKDENKRAGQPYRAGQDVVDGPD
jgi:deoxyadenosine/deoxycytidine kinase